MESQLLTSSETPLSSHEVAEASEHSYDASLERMIARNRSAVHVLSDAKQPGIPEVRAKLDAHIADEQTADLGPVTQRTDLQSSLSPFLYFPEYRVAYPESVKLALCALYEEYNQAFHPLIASNRETETDYRYCTDGHGDPMNHIVQIDMVGLPDTFLREAGDCDSAKMKEVLRERIFEIENSVAMYQFLMQIFSRGRQESSFSLRFRASLDALRKRFGKPIALLAITEEKYAAMKSSEFGKAGEDVLTGDEVRRLAGFDAFFDPMEFRRHCEQNNGKCGYLLYVRSSDPVSMLKDPRAVVKNPLLRDPGLRRIIRANALTLNIDNPDGSYQERINDTKEYLPALGMGCTARTLADVLPEALIGHLQRGKGLLEYSGERYREEVVRYLHAKGIDPSGDPDIRGKPMKGAYGCYGQVRGKLSDGSFRNKLRRNMESRGPYVIQAERTIPVTHNGADGIAYQYIDRNFFATIDSRPQFLGGFRTLLPVTTEEARNGRNHGSRETVFAEICDELPSVSCS